MGFFLAKIVIAFYFFQKNLSAVYDDTFVCFFYAQVTYGMESCLKSRNEAPV